MSTPIDHPLDSSRDGADDGTHSGTDTGAGMTRPDAPVQSAVHDVDRDLDALTPLADEAVALVRRWLDEAGDAKPDAAAARLAGLLKDPDGLHFAIGFVDRVARPEDLRVAARNLEELSERIPKFLPAPLRGLIAVGGGFARFLPNPIIPISRRVLRSMVGHLIVDATPEKLGATLANLRENGDRLNINLLGEAVLGDAEADKRLAGIHALVARDDVDYVSVKVSSIVSQLSMWAFDETVARVVERLVPLYEEAARSGTFLNLDMEEFRDLDLTIAVFERLLDRPSLQQYEAGIVLQAYLPEAVPALERLTAWAQRRRALGGAGIKVRVVKGANLAMERVDAAVHGWPVAVLPSKQASDANYKRVLELALRPDRVDAVRIGVAGHNLFDIAWAHLLAGSRGVSNRVEFEMLLGMAPDQTEAVRRTVGSLLLYTPVVHTEDFESAISYLIRRLEENASTENFLSGAFELANSHQIFAREQSRFLASLADLIDHPGAPEPHRVQNRLTGADAARELPLGATAASVGVRDNFDNEPDTDPALPANREWGRAILARAADSQLGADAVAAAAIATPSALEREIADARTAASAWASRSADDRADVLHAAGRMMAARRAELLEVMVAEAGKTLAEGDPEISEAIDFAHYYAESARELARVDGARFEPVRLTVVVPPWNFPVAIPAGGVLAALAAGSAVIIKPAPQVRRCAAVMVQALWDAGVPHSVLRLVDVPENALGQQLMSHPAVDRVVLTGAFETAALFRSWRADLPLLAETSGKNAIIVTPSADFDLAAADLARSAFGHAGQKCSAASLGILVGSVADSPAFRRQLVDAVRTLRVGSPLDPTTVVGPLIEPASGKLLRALTELAPGEEWLIEPQRLDESGRLWSPGVRLGVAPGSEFHTTEYFGPVLGLMRARDLDEALELQNTTPFGLTAGLHSLDVSEVDHWAEHVEAGNLYVNRGITGAIVRRQPFGGWKRSSVGGSTKAGGPSYVAGFGTWMPVARSPKQNLSFRGLSAPVRRVLEAAQPGLDFAGFDFARAGALSDERAWADEFGVSRDVSDLGVERNVLRYRVPTEPVVVRLAAGGSSGSLVRVLLAAVRAGAPVAVSTPIALPSALLSLAEEFDSPLAAASFVIESDAAFTERVVAERPARIRLIGGDGGAADQARELFAALDGDPDVAIWSGPITAAGRVELLPFVREQSVSVTAHRFGNPYPALAELPL
ncbi:proline dehydrogenase family protein [Yonghaparkia sp. Root332]|uniref:proline dehydrogenase family protein n=1 Tax=Yonghaparkia sp. Root332 TaxID=1736516 RepID=UPI001F1A4C50|nr:proline dehydrogenase family protein [Yonghaparkia sp. Root332]